MVQLFPQNQFAQQAKLVALRIRVHRAVRIERDSFTRAGFLICLLFVDGMALPENRWTALMAMERELARGNADR
jgi:hypothetical protein